MNKAGSQPVGIAVFDICDTLYYSNTTHDFVRYVLENEPVSAKKIIYRSLNAKLLPFRYLIIFLSVQTGRDILRSFNVSMLKGLTRQDLAERAKQFVKEFLAQRRIEQIQELLHAKSAAGLRVVLCSSSIEPVVEAIAEELRIEDRVSTSLEYEGDVFTGRFSRDITRSKLQELRDRGLAGDLVYAASDNLSDLELLSAAKESLAIVHNGRKEEFWRDHKFDILSLSL